MPDLERPEYSSWGMNAYVNTMSVMTAAGSQPFEFRHSGGYDIGKANNPIRKNLTGLRFTARDGADGTISTMGAGIIHLLGFKGGRN